MTLTKENTAIVLDSTADFPDAPERFPNFRVVPLYVNLGGESYRDYVDLSTDELYARLPDAPSPPTTSQPAPGDFVRVYEGWPGPTSGSTRCSSPRHCRAPTRARSPPRKRSARRCG
jgi:hypothetical protein